MPSTWPGIEPATLGIEGQRYINSPTMSTFQYILCKSFQMLAIMTPYIDFNHEYKSISISFDKFPSLMLAGSEFQSLGRAIVKEDEYEEVRWDGIVSIVSWRACVQIVVGRKVSEARRQVRRNRRVQDFEEKEK
ncbi:hypothetical protein ANN_19601 [Periplaneta americana]|uniref:Uncharacterized protein n=1 Tax=Periplaneta americana TaxID=6978 RepID=A0ABQ8SAC3_PERAM|nr:hypothetical protein ANN_19601 [Periplaneta americana]